MGRERASRSAMKGGAYLILAVLLAVSTAHAQSERPLQPEPYPPDSLLKGILDFREPTAFRGKVFYINQTEQIIWVEWLQLSLDRPSFEKGWKLVPGEWTIAVQPLNQSQFYDLQQMAEGTVLELVIQLDHEGLRRILSFQELALLPKVYSKFPTSGIIPEK